MVEYRVYEEIRFRHKRSWRRNQAKKRRTEDEVAERVRRRAEQRAHDDIHNPGKRQEQLARRQAKHDRKQERLRLAAAQASGEASSAPGASAQALGEGGVVAEPALASTSAQAFGEALPSPGASAQALGEGGVEPKPASTSAQALGEAGRGWRIFNADWDVEEGSNDNDNDNYGDDDDDYSDEEDKELFPDEEYSPRAINVGAPRFLEHVYYVAFDFEGRYDNSKLIREAGITAFHINEDSIKELIANPNKLPSNYKSFCLRVIDFKHDRIPGWARGKGLTVKKFLFGKYLEVKHADLGNSISEILQQVCPKDARVRLVTHAGDNEESYLKANGIGSFDNLIRGEWIDTQVELRAFDKKHGRPGLANLTDNYLQIPGIDSEIMHNAGNDSYLTAMLVARLVAQAARYSRG